MKYDDDNNNANNANNANRNDLYDLHFGDIDPAYARDLGIGKRQAEAVLDAVPIDLRRRVHDHLQMTIHISGAFGEVRGERRGLVKGAVAGTVGGLVVGLISGWLLSSKE